MEKLSEKVLSFLDSTEGKVFLSTKNGRKFLQKNASIQWLVTQMGRNWIDSQAGRDWLFEKDNQIINFLHEGLSLLTCDSLREWIVNNEKGKHWLHTGHGVKWLQSEDGLNWLETSHGVKWLNAPMELIALVEK